MLRSLGIEALEGPSPDLPKLYCIFKLDLFFTISSLFLLLLPVFRSAFLALESFLAPKRR